CATSTLASEGFDFW
nr:immunoglobulin heavy chain junction region [Macaca mulatta]MOY27420.1 immunoglobulin heavy chain junction region [Macaca mulatta]